MSPFAGWTIWLTATGSVGFAAFFIPFRFTGCPFWTSLIVGVVFALLFAAYMTFLLWLGPPDHSRRPR